MRFQRAPDRTVRAAAVRPRPDSAAASIRSTSSAATSRCRRPSTRSIRQYREPSSGKNWGEPFEFPTFGGPIVFGYRSKDFGGNKQIKLSTWTYCAIANGTISNWNDPAITADNGGHSITGGISESITFFFRSDSSGTSYLFTNKLATTACNQTCNAPYNTAPYRVTAAAARPGPSA